MHRSVEDRFAAVAPVDAWTSHVARSLLGAGPAGRPPMSPAPLWGAVRWPLCTVVERCVSEDRGAAQTDGGCTWMGLARGDHEDARRRGQGSGSRQAGPLKFPAAMLPPLLIRRCTARSAALAHPCQFAAPPVPPAHHPPLHAVRLVHPAPSRPSLGPPPLPRPLAHHAPPGEHPPR